MKRTHWLVLLVVSFFATSGSAYYIFVALQEKSTRTVALQTLPRPMKHHLETPPPTETAPADTVTAPETHAAENETPPPAAKQFRNVLFTFHSSTAKKVMITGDFNNWFPEPLKKTGKNGWSTILKIEPGTYEYQLVVDGKKKMDPNSKQSKNGKSILTVKPSLTSSKNA